MKMMKSAEFVEKARKIATEYKTAYMLGTWGWPCTESNIARATAQYSKNEKYAAKAEKTGGSGFMFDCCGLVKGILWGWRGDAGDKNGGAPYKNSGVPDLDEYGLMQQCTDLSGDFSHVEMGEFLWMSGHCGIYIGGGLAVESTPAWSGGVQITAVSNMGAKAGYNARRWTKHGKLPYVEYDAALPTVTVSLYELAKGAKNPQVKSLQQLLIAKGYSCGIYGDDGDFGADTDKAVRAFQRDNAACGGVDGIVGVKTWHTILG